MHKVVVGVVAGVGIGGLLWLLRPKNKPGRDQPGSGLTNQKNPARAHTRFDVVLTDAGNDTIEIMRLIRNATERSLAAVKTQLDSLPAAITQSMSRADAEALSEALGAAGGTVELRPSTA